MEMKRILHRGAMALVCGTLLAAAPLIAQDTAPQPPPQSSTDAPPPPPGPMHRGDHMPDPAHRAEMLQKRLGLSNDQREQVKGVLTETQGKMEVLRGNEAVPPAGKHQAMMEIRRTEEAKINAILTPDQQKRYADMQAEMRARAEQRRDGAGGAPPPPPPPDAAPPQQ